MKVIPLTQGKSAIVDDEDYELVSRYKWYANKSGNVWYARTMDGGKTILMHWLIMGGKHIDHINGNGLDNRRENLRFATSSQQAMNRPSHRGSTSRYKGVSWDSARGKWLATIGKPSVHLGYFKNEQDAARAYNEDAVKRFGEFARLNEIEEE